MERVFSDEQVAQIRRNLQTVMVVLQDDRIDGGPDSIAGNLVGAVASPANVGPANRTAQTITISTQHMGISSSMLRLIIFNFLLRGGIDIF